MAVESTFTMNLNTEGVDSTNAAADSLQRLALQIKDDRAELFAMQAALKNLAGSTSVAGETIQALKDKIEIHKIVIADAQASYIAMGGTFTSQAKRVEASAQTVAAAVDPLKSRLNALSEAASLEVANRDLAALKAGLVADQQAVDRLKQALAQLGPETSTTAGLVAKLKGELEHTEARIGAAGVRFTTLGGSLNDVADSVRAARAPVRPLASSLSELAGWAALLPGPLATGVSRLSALAALMKAGGLVAGVLALAAAFVAVVAGTVAAVVGLAKFAFASSEARRENELALQGLVATSKHLRGQRDSWQTLDSTIAATAFRFRTTQDRVQGLAEKLYQGGLRGRFLQTALAAATTAALAGGDEAANAATKQAIAIGNAGGAMDRFGAKVEKNMGAVARARALTLGAQFDRLKQNIGGVFSGLNLDAFASQFAGLVDLFDMSTETGKGMKALFGDLFQGLVDGATDGVAGLKGFVKRLVLSALEIRVEYYKIRNGIRDAFKGSWFDLDVSPMKVALGAIGAIAAAIAVPLALLAVAGAAIAGVFAAGFYAGTLLAKGLDALVTSIPKALAAVGEWLSAGWELGKALVGGIVDGIKAAAGWALDAVSGLGEAMLSVFKTDNEIHSPSAKWARETGKPIAAGLGIGVRAGTPDAVNATVSMSDAVASAFRQGGGGAAPAFAVQTNAATGAQVGNTGRGNVSRSISIGDVSITIPQLPPNVNAQQLATQVWEIFVERLEESAAMSGAFSG